MKFTIKECLEKLPLPPDDIWQEGIYFTTAFKRKDVSLEFFAPRGNDYQTMHEEDEFYFIVSGSGELIIGSEKFTCKVGDSFFVSAKTSHHFENFTEDFAVWAVFF